LKRSLKEARTWEKEANRALQALNRQVALNVVGGLVEDLQEKYQGLPEVVGYLKSKGARRGGQYPPVFPLGSEQSVQTFAKISPPGGSAGADPRADCA
jgi:hypothetical protein